MLLEALWTHGALSQTELADRLGVSRATITVSLRPLVKAGLVVRTTDPDDGRIIRVFASPGSQAIRAELYEIWDQLNEETVSELNEDEIRFFEHVLRVVRKNLTEKRSA